MSLILVPESGPLSVTKAKCLPEPGSGSEAEIWLLASGEARPQFQPVTLAVGPEMSLGLVS